MDEDRRHSVDMRSRVKTLQRSGFRSDQFVSPSLRIKAVNAVTWPHPNFFFFLGHKYLHKHPTRTDPRSLSVFGKWRTGETSQCGVDKLSLFCFS